MEIAGAYIQKGDLKLRFGVGLLRCLFPRFVGDELRVFLLRLD